MTKAKRRHHSNAPTRPINTFCEPIDENTFLDVIKLYAGDTWYSYALIGLVAILCYYNGLDGEFVHDDIPAITLNKDVIGKNQIAQLFHDDFWGTPMSDANSHKSYRPLTVLSFRINFRLFGLKPFWFHLTNIVLHAVVCILFTRVCIIVAGLQKIFAIIAGIIFAIHPIHTEAVTGIVGRADVLACIFFLISLLIYHGKIDYPNCRGIWLSIFFGGISMLSKETGITVFLLNLTYDFYRAWPALKRSILELHCTEETLQFYRRMAQVSLSMSFLLAVRLALLQGSLPQFSPQDNPTAFHSSFYVRLLTFCYLAAFNWWLVLCPSNLSHDWQMGSIPLLTSYQDPRNLLTIWAFLSAFLLFHRGIMDFENHRSAPLVLGFLLLVLPFLPAMNLFVTVGFVVAERVLYIPSLGCILLVAYGAQLMWNTMLQYRKVMALMGLLLISVGTCKTLSRNRDWYSRENLLLAGLKVLPHNAKMHYNFANFLRDSYQHNSAEQHYLEALRLWPSYASAHNNLGTLINNSDSAEDHFKQAIMFSSDHVNAHFNLAQLYLRNNRSQDAKYLLKRCIALEPAYIPAYLELSKAYQGIHSGRILRDATKVNPLDNDLRTTFGFWLLENGLVVGAMEQFQTVLKQNKTHHMAFLGFCRCLRLMGQQSRLNLVISRWQLMYRLAHGGVIHKGNLYQRDWSIRSELQHKAYIYKFGLNSVLNENSTRSSSLLLNFTTSSANLTHSSLSLSATSQAIMAQPISNRIKFRQLRTNNDYLPEFCNKSKKYILFANASARKTTDITTCNKSYAIKRKSRRKYTNKNIVVPRVFVNILDNI